MNKPLVSVVIGTYNHEPYIRQCLDSVLGQQTNFEFEVVLGEDNSADNTRLICKEYAHKFPQQIKLHLRHRDDVIFINGRPTGRFNFIENLNAAQGTYIALCDGDDYWNDPNKLQEQVDLMQDNPGCAGSFHDSLIKIEGANQEPKLWRTYSKTEFDYKDTIATKSLFHTSSFLFKREFLIIPSWFKEVQSADMALFSLIAANGFLKRIPKPMSVYRKNASSITNAIVIKEYHLARIKLQEVLGAQFPAMAREQQEQVIAYHKSELSALRRQQFKNRIKRIFKGNG